MLKEILENLNLHPGRYECEKIGPDHLPNFVVKIGFADRFGNHDMYGYQAHTKKEAENDASLSVIRHLRRCYDIIVKDVNKREMLELRYEIENTKESNEELWKCHTETVRELSALKGKKKEKELVEELDSQVQLMIV